MLVDMGMLFLLADPRSLGLNVTLSKFCAAEIALINNFGWNEFWTFKRAAGTVCRRGTALRRLLFFNAICGVGIVFAVLLLHFFHAVLGWNLYFSNLLAIGVVTLWNFGMNARFNWLIVAASITNVTDMDVADQEMRAPQKTRMRRVSLIDRRTSGVMPATKIWTEWLIIGCCMFTGLSVMAQRSGLPALTDAELRAQQERLAEMHGCGGRIASVPLAALRNFLTNPPEIQDMVFETAIGTFPETLQLPPEARTPWFYRGGFGQNGYFLLLSHNALDTTNMSYWNGIQGRFGSVDWKGGMSGRGAKPNEGGVLFSDGVSSDRRFFGVLRES
jgi:putative flippase GtrA